MSRLILLTISDDRFGRKNGAYKKTQEIISHLFMTHNAEFGVELVQWDWPRVTASLFYKANRRMLDNIDPARNGRLYKPMAMLEELNKLEFGDYMVYNDCSPELWDLPLKKFKNKYNIERLKKLIQHNDGILTAFVKWDKAPELTNGLGIHTHDNFTLDRCIKRMGAEAHRHDFQHASGFIGLQKTERTVEFMREWVHWNAIDECASMGWAHINDDYSFWETEELRKMGHRHDQSISGLLINKMGGMLVDMPPYEGMNPYNFLQYCREDADYSFITSNNPNGPGPFEIKKGSTVRNENGIELTVFEFMPDGKTEWIAVGKHRQSMYKTTKEHLTLVKQ